METVAITDYTSQSGSTKTRHLIFGSTPYGDYLQMVHELSIQDVDYLNLKRKFNKFNEKAGKAIRRVAKSPKTNKRLEQVEFNEAFMTKVRDENNGKLHCVYCGKPNLIIFYHNQKIEGDRSLMATTDHFLPKGKGGAPRDYANLFVSCSKCNSNKGDKFYPIDSLKYLHLYSNYQDTLNRLQALVKTFASLT